MKTHTHPAGRNITLYLSPPREARIHEIFELMAERQLLPPTATCDRSRARIIDHALDALYERLQQKA